jgi:hypothetical protein
MLVLPSDLFLRDAATTAGFRPSLASVAAGAYNKGSRPTRLLPLPHPARSWAVGT